METIYFKIGIAIERDAMPALVELATRLAKAVRGENEGHERRLRASQNALLAGEKPPREKGLLIDSKQAAKLLNVSERTLWAMWKGGKMPQPIKIGRVVRFSYEELQAWAKAGGPPQNEWRWPGRDR